CAQERLKRLTRDARNQHAQHVGPRVVHPPLTRLVHERQPPQAAHPLIRRRQRRWAWWPHANLLLACSLQDRIRVRRRHHLPEAHAEGKQVTRRDRSVRWHGVVERRCESLQQLGLCQLGTPPSCALVHPHLAAHHHYHPRTC